MTVTRSTAGGRRNSRRIRHEDLVRLRMTLGRLGRVLRQQNDDGLSYALISLMFAIHRMQPATAGDLAAGEGVSPPSVTRSLNRLVELGLVAREADPVDRRNAVISLTAAGEQERQRILRSREVWLSDHLARLTDEQLHALLGVLPVLELLCDPELP
ncbi:MarR family winged helix-turn-helix transcriptional regulator [Phytohabitans suffuscus]|uniref:MarR family transcriptional regulator n=1 Tax=Phytohabitans suffuscus TaxID=624315 RepID=A0A6F8Y9W3_9ACTN|nr:MarR family transcriptional regulator [Phytohabitans suffuscus]BCB82819.1 MarR family transcriptional regulator [Phytohabitans suffuscus]